MEPTSDKRFDPHSGAQLLLEIAQEQSVEPILKKIVEYAVGAHGVCILPGLVDRKRRPLRDLQVSARMS